MKLTNTEKKLTNVEKRIIEMYRKDKSKVLEALSRVISLPAKAETPFAVPQKGSGTEQ